MTTPIPQHVPFLECRLCPVTTRQFIETVVERASSSVPCTPHSAFHISYLNAHCSNLAARDADYRRIVNTADLVYADGQAVVWAARRLGTPVPERVNAGDFIIEFCQACAAKNLSLYLLGGSEGVAERAGGAWCNAAPGLRIAGTHHGFFGAAAPAVADAIREAHADIVLVGMGAPRQELWMEQWGEASGARVVWCVGALFEYYAGVRARAPRWMRRIGFEWAFRLALEPRRLWRRYIIGNITFVRRVLASGRR